MEWEQVVDVSEHVSFRVPAGHTYTNSFVVDYHDDDYFDWDDWAHENVTKHRWFVVVYDGWNGKHSGGSKSYDLPSHWEVI